MCARASVCVYVSVHAGEREREKACVISSEEVIFNLACSKSKAKIETELKIMTLILKHQKHNFRRVALIFFKYSLTNNLITAMYSKLFSFHLQVCFGLSTHKVWFETLWKHLCHL